MQNGIEYNEGDIFTDVFYDEDENTEEVEFMFSKERKYLKEKLILVYQGLQRW